jgi:hypothetical protein
MRESLECRAQLINIPNKAPVYSSRARHPGFFDERAELTCGDADCRGRLDFAKAKYNWQKWQYVDSRGRALHGLYRGGSELGGLVLRQSGKSTF